MKYIMKLLGWTYGLLLILNLMFTVGIPHLELCLEYIMLVVNNYYLKLQ